MTSPKQALRGRDARIGWVLAASLVVGPALGSGVTAARAGSGPAGPADLADLRDDLSAAIPAAAETRTPFVYRLSMPDPQRHEFHVELRLSGVAGERVRLELPKWNPGSYRLTNSHRNVRALAAKLVDGKTQTPVGVAKIDENTWEVVHGGKDLVVDYRVYCGSYSGIGGCYLDDEFGFANGVHVFMYAVGHKSRPIELEVTQLPGLREGGGRPEVVTGLPKRGGSKSKFWASDYDVLVDSPIHAGVVDTVRFELGGRPIRATLSREGAWKADEVRAELEALTRAAADVFGPLDTALPFTDYTFIYQVLPDNSGGLEHLNSTVIGVDPWWFADNRGKRRFWSVSAHEFFHLWNVKRIRPAVLGPFDYDNEVHTTMLWFSEGFTSYYAILIASRAGLLEEHQALDDLERRIAAVETKPGRKLMSVEQSSWETWATPDDNDNAYFSYYDKGAVIGLVMDLHLRAASNGAASTDTVFRKLWQRYRDTGLGLTPAQLEQVFVDELKAYPDAAKELAQMFTDYVRGVSEIDYDRYLAHAGYRLVRSVPEPGPSFGAQTRVEGGAVVVRSVAHGGPGDRGGLAQGDRIQAIDGQAIEPRSFDKIMASLSLGEAHVVTVERLARVVELRITPVEGGDERFEIVELDTVTADQELLRKQWLGLD